MSRWQFIFRATLLFAILFSKIFLMAVETEGRLKQISDTAEIRALWVTRWDYRSPEDVQRIMNNAAKFNFNMVLFQVRGDGTVLYPSAIEPWVDVPGLKGKYPAWDPLQTAISAARKHKLQLHAWINLYVGGSTSKIATNRGKLSYLTSVNCQNGFLENSRTVSRSLEILNTPISLWQSHPEWFCLDEDGKPQPWAESSNYLWLEPASQDVQDHLYKLVMELVQNYNLDGIHFDYFRYPGPFVNGTKSSKRSGDAYRREQINNWLRRIYLVVKSQKPDFIISAAVIGDYYLGNRVYLQDSHRWLTEGIIDIIFPMTYTPSNQLLRHWLRTHKQAFHNRYVCPGLMVYQNSAFGKIAAQITEVRKNNFVGYAIFSYQRLFPNQLPTEQALMLKEISQPDFVPVPNISRPNRRLNPVFGEIKIFPACTIQNLCFQTGEMPKVHVPFKVACTLKTTSASNLLSEDYQVFLLWDTSRYFSHPQRIKMQRIFNNEHTQAFTTTEAIVPELKSGAQVMAFRSIAYTKNTLITKIVASDVQFVPILPFSSPSFRQLSGPWGPLIPGANSIALDEEKPAKIWLTSFSCDEIVVLDSSGTPAFFSPLRTVRNSTGKSITVRNPLSVARGVNHTMVVAHYNNAPQLLWLDSRNGRLKYSARLDFYPGDLSVDGRGFIYIIEAESDVWHVLNPRGQELEGSPFRGGDVNQGIAVSSDGRHVYISSRACVEKEDGQAGVHHWIGECYRNHANFYQVADVPAFDTSIGALKIDRENNLYICEPVVGAIRVVNSGHSLLGFIYGDNPPLRAPRDVAVCPNGQLVYVLDTGGLTPVRVQRWKRE